MANFETFKHAVAEYLAAEPHANTALEVMSAPDAAIEQLGRSAHDHNTGFTSDAAGLMAAVNEITSDPESAASIMAAAQQAAYDTWGSLRQTPDSAMANAGISAADLVATAGELANETAADAKLEGVQVQYLTEADLRSFVDSHPEVGGQLQEMLADKLEAQLEGRALEGFGLSDSPEFTRNDLLMAAAADQLQQATDAVYADGGSPKEIGADAYGRQVLHEALVSAGQGEISMDTLVALQELRPADIGGITEALTQSLVEAAQDGRTLDFNETTAAVAASFPADSIVGESPAAAAEATSVFLECATRTAEACGDLTPDQANALRDAHQSALEQFDAQYSTGSYFVEQPATEAEVQALQEQAAQYDREDAGLGEKQIEAEAEHEMSAE